MNNFYDEFNKWEEIIKYKLRLLEEENGVELLINFDQNNGILN